MILIRPEVETRRSVYRIRTVFVAHSNVSIYLQITQKKLQWNAKSKIGSLENATHKPGGGDKKIESVKLDFKDKAKPKVASTVNIAHKPGGGDIKVKKESIFLNLQQIHQGLIFDLSFCYHETLR